MESCPTEVNPSISQTPSTWKLNIVEQKDIFYTVLIPMDPTVSGEEVLTNDKLKTRTGGYPGETLLFWLCATWDASASYWGKIDWLPEHFTCEITNTQYEARFSHISTTEIGKQEIKRVPVVRELSAVVPLSIKLPNRPATSADLTVWKDDFSTHVVTEQIPIMLPLSYVCNFAVENDIIKIALDFAGSSCTVNDYDLHFTPRNNIKLSDYEEAISLRHVEGSPVFELIFVNDRGLRLLLGMYLGLSVVWGKRMISNFDVEVPYPPSRITIVWNIPPNLKRMKQAKLDFDIQNISPKPFDTAIEIVDSPVIPLEKRVIVRKLEPGEKRCLSIPCIPTVAGIHRLNYRVLIGRRWHKPLFKTVVQID